MGDQKLDKKNLRLIGGLLVVVSVFLPINFTIVKHNQKTYYITSWIFGLNYEDRMDLGQTLTFTFRWLSILITILVLIVGIIIIALKNEGNEKRLMILSSMLFVFRVFYTTTAVVTGSRVAEYSTTYIPHVGFFVVIIGCILVFLSQSKSK